MCRPCLESPPPLRAPNQQPTHHARRNRQPAHNRNPHQSFLRNLIINQPPQTHRLHIPALQLQQQIVIPPGLGIVAQLVVPEREPPGVVEFRLQRDVFAFFLELGPQDLEFGGFQWTRVGLAVRVMAREIASVPWLRSPKRRFWRTWKMEGMEAAYLSASAASGKRIVSDEDIGRIYRRASRRMLLAYMVTAASGAVLDCGLDVHMQSGTSVTGSKAG
ncbi:hypothetical protein M8818_001556 [Zalaria obscura]|uniref:Uncharacterized protein n=1 Tax=Zalaria obscura TaxID=2024903 RepID=A0ACC3SKL0_9PEZI